jgi:histidine triad (HIT) family protein
MVAAAKQLAAEHANGEYRLIFNNGASAAQSVFHVHAHVLADIEENKLVGF